VYFGFRLWKKEEYNNYLNSYNDEQGRTFEGSQEQPELLSEARTGNLGGNQRNESEWATGEVVGTSDNNSEASQESASGSEVNPFAERAEEWEENKKALETVSASRTKHHQTAISSA
jgi:hypothetical protein